MANRKPRQKKTYLCIQCGNVAHVGSSKLNKYCSLKCQADYRWENVTKPKIEAGNGSTDSPSVKRYLAEKHGDKCSVCTIPPIWNNMKLVLQVDHIDGNSDNNQPENLRLICPNCHTQTSNWGVKGLGKRYKKVTKRNSYLQAYKATGRTSQQIPKPAVGVDDQASDHRPYSSLAGTKSRVNMHGPI